MITGVEDRIPECLRHVIYFDAAVPEDGQSMYDLVGGPPPGANVIDGLYGNSNVDGFCSKSLRHESLMDFANAANMNFDEIRIG